MEAQDPAINELQQIDIVQAVNDLQIQNQVFEERFISIGDALAQITSGMQELQNSMKDLIFNRQGSGRTSKIKYKFTS